MQTIKLQQETLQAGSSYLIKATVTWEGATINTARAAFVDTLETDSKVKLLTDPIALTLDNESWTGIIPKTETAGLLAAPDDLLSKLKVASAHLIVKLNGTDADGTEIETTLYSAAIKIGRSLID